MNYLVIHLALSYLGAILLSRIPSVWFDDTWDNDDFESQEHERRKKLFFHFFVCYLLLWPVMLAFRIAMPKQ